jgi:quercetin dioxygenase-like cupin family protein
MKLECIPWNDARPPTEAELRRRLGADGFDVMVWSDSPGRAYTPHLHDHDESLWCVRGAIVFEIVGKEYPLGVGDRLMLPRGTVHAAVVGPHGATYLIGERQA